MRAARILPIVMMPFVSACGDDGIFGIGSHDYEGFYSYAGTVDEASGDAVFGTVTVTRQRGSSAQVAIEWTYLDNGEPIIDITTDSPALAHLGSDGWIDFDFDGDLYLDDEVVSFHLHHEGRLRGRTITGYWEFNTGLPTTDAGSFTARRD
jgi:hypothetical protein